MPSPTFFLVGAPKAGTTSLFHYLGQHPAIAIASVKEPCYYAPEVPVDADTDRYRQSRDAYLSLFAHAGDRRVIGEGSVAYFSSAHAAAAIRAAHADAKILVMLRDPADRLFAHYAAAVAAGLTREPFAHWISETADAEAARTPRWGPIWAGCYGTHLATWRAHFPADQIHLCDYADFSRDPDAVLTGIFTFLGVDPRVRIDHRARLNVTTRPRFPRAITAPARAVLARLLPATALARVRGWARTPAPHTPTATERANAIALYRDEIASLSAQTGRHYSHWLR